jgi:hypothetical protein
VLYTVLPYTLQQEPLILFQIVGEYKKGPIRLINHRRTIHCIIIMMEKKNDIIEIGLFDRSRDGKVCIAAPQIIDHMKELSQTSASFITSELV